MSHPQEETILVQNPDETQLNVSLKYWVLVIGLLITVSAAILVSVYVPKVEVRDIVAVITGGVVSTTLIYHVMNYHLNYQVNVVKFRYDNNKLDSDRRLQAITMTGEWHKPDMIRHTIAARDFLEANKAKDPKEFEKELLANESARIAIIIILNFFERISIAIEARVVDDNIMKDFFKGLFNEYYHGTKGYVSLRRTERQNDKIFIKFESLSRRWNP